MQGRRGVGVGEWREGGDALCVSEGCCVDDGEKEVGI